jgi:thymidylate synthase ThyX
MTNIKANVVQDSISLDGVRLTTFELEYPRFIHAEFMTHRQFSRNCASSRAIPLSKMHEQIETNMATPVYWGVNEPGMQASRELEGLDLGAVRELWHEAGLDSVRWSQSLGHYKVHKQIANRVTEPFQMMKTVVTATEWDNWFWLRNHKDAQPEIAKLAKCMIWQQSASRPIALRPGEWHVPYVKRTVLNGQLYYWDSNELPLDAHSAKIISASCCAQVSYRTTDDTLDKAKLIFDKLINSEPCHASPVEHQATPMTSLRAQNWPDGLTHKQRDGTCWSGNFRGWIQHRQLIPNHSR